MSAPKIEIMKSEAVEAGAPSSTDEVVGQDNTPQNDVDGVNQKAADTSAPVGVVPQTSLPVERTSFVNVPALKLPLPYSSISEATQSNNFWTVVAHAGTTAEQYEYNPLPFRDIAQNFSVFDQVFLHAHDGSYWAQFLVVKVDRNAALLELLKVVHLENDDDQKDVIPGFQIRPAQPGDGQPGWIVINRDTGIILNVNFQILGYDAAVQYLKRHPQVHPRYRSSELVG